jgi:hypothetical protein
VFGYYGGSRISQILAQLVLQFSVLSLLFSSGQRGSKKEKKGGEMAFSANKLSVVPIPVHSRTSLVVMCNKKLFLRVRH